MVTKDQAREPSKPLAEQKSHRTRKQPKAITPQRLRAIALAYLNRYEASEATLRAVLERRVLKATRALGGDPSTFNTMIDDEIAYARSHGFVDDRRFAANMVHQQRARGASTRAIAARLRSKGIADDAIADVLQASDVDDDQAAWRYAQRRRLGPYRHHDRAARRDRDLAALCRAGFAYRIAVHIIDSEREEAP